MTEHQLEKSAGGSAFHRLLANLFIPAHSPHGVETLASFHFWLALGCYIASFLLIMREPVFWQAYSFKLQGLLPVILAVILASDLNWEMLLTGRPKGCNLFLQIIMVIPLALLISRMISPYQAEPKDSSTLQWLFTKAHEVMNSFLLSFQAWVPKWLLELVCHPWLGLLIIGILLILCIKNHLIRLSSLLLVMLVMFASTIVKGFSWPFVLAAIAFIAGVTLQWNPYRKIAYLCNVRKRLGHQSGEYTMFQVIIDTMEKLYERQEINGHEFEQIVREHYAPHLEYSRDEQRLIMNEILRRMVEGYRLVTLDVTINGTTMHPINELYECNRLLANITVVPRFIAVACIAIVWMAMPFDALPDTIPLIGMLDDLAVCWLSAWIGKDSLKRVKQHSQPRIGI